VKSQDDCCAWCEINMGCTHFSYKTIPSEKCMFAPPILSRQFECTLKQGVPVVPFPDEQYVTGYPKRPLANVPLCLAAESAQAADGTKSMQVLQTLNARSCAVRTACARIRCSILFYTIHILFITLFFS
jgi:hypothetical protein